MARTKIIALDDDPTGSQTVHSCLLLTRWDPATLREALEDSAPLFFVLTNTRGMDAVRAAAITREVCRNLRQALDEFAEAGNPVNPLLVSRSDSTLRGHYPVETDIIAEELGPFDAHFLVPAFFEGGRITRDAVHYLMVDGEPVPVHRTEFAKDSVFGFTHSYLPDYVEEKTDGRISAQEVERFLLDDVRRGCRVRLSSLKGNTCGCVDGEAQSDLDSFADQVLNATADGKRFLFRSAASLLKSLAKLSPQPVPAEEMFRFVRNGRPGAVLVGSHVRKATLQLQRLLDEAGTVGIEADVDAIDSDREALLRDILSRATAIHKRGETPIIYTSRTEKVFDSESKRLAFGERVSDFLTDVVRGLPPTLGYLISKGGITSNDVLNSGLELRTSRVLGQVLPGCSVVRCPADHDRFPGLPVVIFPGNVGDDNALARGYRRMADVPVVEERAGTA
ncbi:four-carbon acid sugar kinase family protein [Thiohalomonas denitrificans]|uniref:Uncharacterized conserved protein YgbK, DUF1537 family n=1 Tax=Thiohalomonas denitrificans TaxID=415747 RepID=A0A1G5QHC9_9GAMM|nr:four-carbon acid sugar kinase family protein [Thiohalomonas denitrificans]SCZ61273.1 Uncharacterized conserved protein YgbK, DUF1537 family [Thiohalomonas denitrificans]